MRCGDVCGESNYGDVFTNVNPYGDAYLEDPASTCAAWSSADPLKSASPPPPPRAAAV